MKQNTAEYLTKAERSISASRQLLEQGHPDFSASRSYYAIFYCVTALFEEEGRQFSSHAKIIGAFGYEYIRTGKLPQHLGTRVQKAFDLRSEGDYGLEFSVTEPEARETLQHAEEFLQEIRRYLMGDDKKE